MSTPEFRYRAFISYSHHDERTARWLHGALERYRVPRRLVGRRTTVGAVPARISPVFRDREELPTATDLGRAVSAALEQSSALIVICSPAAAQSRWVGEEIRAFRRLGRQERIFCVIVAGEPNGLGDADCFPPGLLEPLGAGGDSAASVSEPIAADLRPGKDGRTAALLKIVAGLLGVGLDELARRDAQRRQRHLTAIAAASVAGMAAASLLAALALISRNEAERQRARAEVEAATAQQTSEFLVQLFQVADPGEARGNSITAREVLDRGAVRIDRELQQQPVVRANLMYTMGRVYTGLGLYQPASDLLQRAWALRRQMQGGPTPDSVDTANALGAALYLKGEYEEAEKVYRDALSGAEKLHPGGDPQVSEAVNGVADLLSQRGEFAAAETEYAAALAIDRRLHGNMHPDVARSLAGLASALLYEQRYAESEAAYREALAIRRQTLGNDHPLVAETLANLGALLYFSGQREATEPVLREAVDRYRHIFGNEHPNVSSALNNLGRVLLEQGKVAEAAPLLSEALDVDRKLKDPGHDDFVYTLNNLSLARLAAGQVKDAEPLLEEALRIAEHYRHRMRGEIWTNLADVYWRLGRVTDALHAVEAARPLLEDEYPDEPWHEAYLANVEGAARLAAGQREQAGALLLQSYPVVEAKWGREGLFTRLAAGRVAGLYDARGNPALARQYRLIADVDAARPEGP
ncbi:MAG TPA: toll/interleukin-1 receptor domain-containing protein [Gammaproteobacteria bacterium]|nr:toll/interleukin-1 receptor domain-containing protein [Gammaproteobacteria bacterium]